MCGHGTIGTVTMALEHGLVRPQEPGILRLDTPAGVVTCRYREENGFVEEVRLTNVPAFLHAEGIAVEGRVAGGEGSPPLRRTSAHVSCVVG